MGVTRRGVILGSAVAGTAAVAGVGAALHAAGGGMPRAASPTSPVPSTPAVTVRRGAMGTARWWVALPPGSSGNVPVVVAFHGRGGSAEGLLDAYGLDQALAASGHQFALAAIDGDPDGFWHPRADGRDPLHLVLEAFLPALKAYALQPAGLIGWSMGGYGALLVDSLLPRGQKLPVCAVSPGIFTDAQSVPDWAFDGPDDFRQWDLRTRWDIHPDLVRIDCGKQDDLYPAVRSFAHQRHLDLHATPGGHDLDYWRRVLPAELDWLADRIG